MKSAQGTRSLAVVWRLAGLACAAGAGGCLLPPEPGRGGGGGAASTAFSERVGGSKPQEGSGSLTLGQVDAWTNAFADRWASFIQDATRRILAGPVTAEQRKAALTLQSASISSVYDIAVRTDPLTQLLDMVVLAALERRVWVTEGGAERVFGERGRPLADAIESLYTDITLTSINALNSEQYEQLMTTIDDWRSDHPDIRSVEFVRFSEFATARATDLTQQIRSSGLFAPIDDATRAAEQLKALAERGMWVGIRAPQLLSWQAEGFVDSVLTRPEISDALAGNESLVKSADRLSRAAETLPESLKSEREALVKALDEREQKLDSSVREVRTTVEEGRKLLADTEPVLKNAESLVRSVQELTRSLNETLKAVDQLTARFTGPAGDKGAAKPAGDAGGDVKQYTEAAEKLTVAVRELNTLVASTGGVVASPAWRQRLDEFDALGRKQLAEARAQAVSVSDALFWRGAGLIGVFFVGLCGWTLLRWKLK